jgi:CRISPR-associated protein Cas1
MYPFYVIHQNAKLRLKNKRLIVEKNAEVLASTPLGHVSEIILYGNIGLTTPLIGTLLRRGIDVIFLKRDGSYKGRLSGGLTPHVPLRKSQYRALDNPEFKLQMAKLFVRAKMRHQRALLQRHNKVKKDPVIISSIARINEGLKNLMQKTALASLRGVEGSTSAAYFCGLRKLFAPEWHFNNRNRRPPKDPVNVFLSFGYTLLSNAADGAVRSVGLDPYAGFLHEISYKRPALGLDLLEEFRPVIDGLALWVCNSDIIRPDDFNPGPPSRPIVLSDQGKRIFLKAYEERMSKKFTHPVTQSKLSLRQSLSEQARQIARAVRSAEAQYKTMGFR